MQVFLAAALALLGACAPIAPPNPAGQEQALQWTVLLDDAGPRGLRTMGEQALRPQWQMTDGALVLTTPGGGDFTDGKVYRDFELIVEWAVPEAGNSGIFLRADPDEGTAAWKSAVEYQLLDNAGHPNGADLATSAGAVFALYPTLSQALAPIGSFNTTRIVAKGPVIEHYLNGTLAARYDTASADFAQRVGQSKFARFAGFGTRADGLLVFQDHQDRVAFRLIKVRTLGP